MAEGVPTNNQNGRRSGPCRLWGGLDKARHTVPIALLVRVQCFRKGTYKAEEGPSTRPLVLSMISGIYCRHRIRLSIFEPDEMKLGVSLTFLDWVCFWPSSEIIPHNQVKHVLSKWIRTFNYEGHSETNVIPTISLQKREFFPKLIALFFLQTANCSSFIWTGN